MVDMRKHFVLVAALEFGTTYAGLAFSTPHGFETDPLKIFSYFISKSMTFRSVICLLLDKEKQFVAFGYDAAYRYADLVMDEEQDDYYFFDHFTMSLHNNENVTRDMVLKDKTGKQCSAVEAGINPEKLLLVNEPDAVFTYCHYIPTTRLHGSKPGHMIKEPGTKSMVVDLGDMTADITVLQQTFNGQLKVLCRATGDDCGSTLVDDRFCKMLEEIIGRNVTTEFNREEPRAWLEILRRFRTAIKRITTSNTKVIRFDCLSSLNDICEKLHGKDLKSVIKSSSYGDEITLSRYGLVFKADLMIKLVTPTIDSIITLMKNTVSNRSTNGVSNNVSNIVMVGGLSECPMIQDAVYKAFPDNQIIIPVNADLSVLSGAVLFGHRPDYIWSELRDEEGIGK